MSKRYLSDKSVAERYDVHRSTVWRWVREDPKFPKPVRINGSTRWDQDELQRREAEVSV